MKKIFLLLFFLPSCTQMVPPTSSHTITQDKPKLPPSVDLVVSTTRGNFLVRIYLNKAGKSAKVFLKLVKSGFYNGRKFFRVIKTPFPYLIQTGAPQNNPFYSKIKPTKAEIGKIHHLRGSLALSTDPVSGGITSQFYILLSDATYLDNKDPVIGEVIEGMRIVEKINKNDYIQYIRIKDNG